MVERSMLQFYVRKHFSALSITAEQMNNKKPSMKNKIFLDKIHMLFSYEILLFQFISTEFWGSLLLLEMFVNTKSSLANTEIFLILQNIPSI